jgi:DNA-binding CsgD family transcriptional regulator
VEHPSVVGTLGLSRPLLFTIPMDAVQLLTIKELDVYEMLVKGMQSKEVALKLNISVRTVKFHIVNIYEKLNVHDRGQLIWSYKNKAAVFNDETLDKNEGLFRVQPRRTCFRKRPAWAVWTESVGRVPCTSCDFAAGIVFVLFQRVLINDGLGEPLPPTLSN